MARTLIWNTSATAQTLPASYGGGAVQPGYGWIVADESSVVVAALGGFDVMDGKWSVAAISTDEALGTVDMNAAGVALVADVAAALGGGGGGGGGPVSWAAVTGKPTFATVATSGSYADLSNKPSIPVVPVLADVATSGDYADLIGKPSIPAAGNTAATDISSSAAAGVQSAYARVDHQHAHGSQAGGTLHSAATTMAAGFMSAADKSKLDGLATVATSGAYADLSGTPSLFSGAYADLSGKPSLFSGSYTDLTNKPTLFSGSYSDLTNKPTFAAVATSGAYSDLSGKPTLAAVATTGSYASLTGAPALATVATSGSYTDLTSKPSLFSGAYADLTGKPTLATVATSGSYTDLTSKPSLATVATSGSYNDLRDLPLLSFSTFSGSYTDLTNQPTLFDGTYASLTGKPTLATVATSGSYADLSNKPTKAYDIASFASGALALNATTMKFYAPKALTLTALNQGGGATVKIQVAGADITYPKSVTAGQVISAVVTGAGTDNYFTISAVEA